MRTLVTTFGIVLTLGIAVGGLPAESRAAQAMLGCPATAQAGQELAIEVTIDVGTTPLGAYSIVVTYDPAVLTVADVGGGSTPEFSGTPTANTPTPGTTNLNGFQSASLTSPTGTVSVAMVTFNVAATASGTTAIGLTVTSLFDTNSVAIAATGTGCGVSVTGGASTTTSSTSTTIVTVTTSTTTLPPSTTTTSSSTPTSTTSLASTTTTTRGPTTSTSSTTTTTRPPTTTISTSTSTTTRPPITTTTTSTRPPTTTTTTTARPPTTTTTTTTSSTSSTTGSSPTTTSAPPTTGQCPQGSGFWKNHRALWPVSSLTLGSQAYAQAELLAIFTTPVRGDASLILTRSLIVAKLNIANGSDPTPIADTIADADALLSGFAGKLPYQVSPSSTTGKAMVHDAGILDRYNSGALTPTCDAAVSELADSTALLLGQLETIAAACSGDGLPLGLHRRLARTQRLLVRTGTRTGKPAQALLRRAASQLREAAQLANREASTDCSGALDGILVDLGGRAER